MPRLIALLLALALGLGAAPALANVVEVTTTVALADVADQEELNAAIHEAVNEVLNGTIAFRPTLIALTRANVIGERLYVRVLLADAQGEQLLRELVAESVRAGEDQDPI